MVEEKDVFVGISYPAKMQYDEFKHAVDKASDSFNKFKLDNKKYEDLISKLSDDLKGLHSSFEAIFDDLNKSEEQEDNVQKS